MTTNQSGDIIFRLEKQNKQMLEALKEVKSYIDPVDTDVLDIVTEAISKAEGEE